MSKSQVYFFSFQQESYYQVMSSFFKSLLFQNLAFTLNCPILTVFCFDYQIDL